MQENQKKVVSLPVYLRLTKNQGTMKKVLFLFLMIAMVSCNNQPDGGRNAAEFVKEQIPKFELAEIIEPTNMIEVGVIDTDYFLESINEKRSPSNRDKNWLKFYDRLNTQYMMAEKTWEGNQKYIELAHRVDVEFRKVYTISITMPSQTKDSVRVIMQADGITPWMIEEVYLMKLRIYKKVLYECYWEALEKDMSHN